MGKELAKLPHPTDIREGRPSPGCSSPWPFPPFVTSPETLRRDYIGVWLHRWSLPVRGLSDPKSLRFLAFLSLRS